MGLVVNLDPFVIPIRGLVVSRGSHATEPGRHTVRWRGLRKGRSALDRLPVSTLVRNLHFWDLRFTQDAAVEDKGVRWQAHMGLVDRPTDASVTRYWLRRDRNPSPCRVGSSSAVRGPRDALQQ